MPVGPNSHHRLDVHRIGRTRLNRRHLLTPEDLGNGATAPIGGFVVATRSRTPVALTSLAGNQFMKAYRIMTPFWARGEGEEEEKRKKRRGEGYCRTQARRVIRSLFFK